MEQKDLSYNKFHTKKDTNCKIKLREHSRRFGNEQDDKKVDEKVRVMR